MVTREIGVKSKAAPKSLRLQDLVAPPERGRGRRLFEVQSVKSSCLLALLLAIASCSRSTSAPPTIDPAPSARSQQSSQPASPIASSAPSPNTPARASASLVASSSPPAPSDAASPLIGPDDAPLPQTEDKPSASSAAFRKNVELVAAAILSGDPMPAHPAFFPLVAYQQVKAIADPARDYERRLLAS